MRISPLPGCSQSLLFTGFKMYAVKFIQQEAELFWSVGDEMGVFFCLKHSPPSCNGVSVVSWFV